MNNINRVIGQRVRELRDAAEATQEALAEHLHTTNANVSRKESGKIPFTVEELYEVAAFFECKVTDLLPDQHRSGDEDDEWAAEGSPAAFYNGLPPDTQSVVYEMIKAAHKQIERERTTHGRKAE